MELDIYVWSDRRSCDKSNKPHDINKDVEEFVEKREEKLRRINTRSMTRKNIEEMKRIFQEKLTRGRPKALEKEIRGLIHE